MIPKSIAAEELKNSILKVRALLKILPPGDSRRKDLEHDYERCVAILANVYGQFPPDDPS